MENKELSDAKVLFLLIKINFLLLKNFLYDNISLSSLDIIILSKYFDFNASIIVQKLMAYH